MNGEKKVPSPHSPLGREIRFAPFFIDGGNLGRNTGVKSTILSSEYFARTKTQNILAPIRTERENIYFAQKIFITVEQWGECDLDMRRDSCFSNGSQYGFTIGGNTQGHRRLFCSGHDLDLSQARAENSQFTAKSIFIKSVLSMCLYVRPLLCSKRRKKNMKSETVTEVSNSQIKIRPQFNHVPSVKSDFPG